ncbi:hypothetical protein HYT23_00115 [Candidatus Pacearchaeota archaeon]|nr:hypothetical protein [Candidatus Pacearchaeota archaeon]
MTKKNSKRGKKARASGVRFELKVRQNLESMGWIVSKWMNTVDKDKTNILRLMPAKRKYNPFFKVLGIGTGFPDFVAFKKVKKFVDADGTENDVGYEVIGIEVKANGYLDKIEKDMCSWLLENKIFSRILIAKKSKERGKIDYVDFGKKYKL